jgi:two-component system phosphate regulon sensor histidine kinase PhoR
MARENSIRTILDALSEPALLVEDGRVRMANSAAAALLGASIEGRDIRLVIRHPEALERLFEGRAGDFEVSGIGAIERPWTLSVRAIESGEMLVRLVDRTVTVAAERMRVDFVANASHELRTPLSTVLGYAETIAEDPDVDAELRVKFAGIIRSEAKRMLAVIEDLMNLSRIEAGRFVAPTERLDLAEIASEAAAGAESLAEKKGCRIEVKVGDGLPSVRGDRGQLLQLIDNLLSNAIRYGCRDGCDLVQLSVTGERGWVRVSVADSGPGIAREHLPRVTERFYRVDAARSRDSGGTGLGLAIVKHIVERHRGTLDIQSTPGTGTEVIARFPADGR